LYKQAKQENDDKNTVVSPAAVQLTLAALQKGARGNTKAQIRRAQCPGLTQQQCQQAHAAMIRSLKATQNVQQTQTPGRQSGQQSAKINVPTTIILNQQTPAQRQFAQTVQQCLGGQVKQCSFKRNPQQCRQQINRLISTKTNQKLQTAVPQQAITQNTKMVAVSALQLNAKWGQQFRQQQTTKQGRFYPLGSQQPKRTQVIQSQGQFNYHEDDQVQVVGIPTQQQELTLYIIVPKEKDGLTQVEKQQIQNGQQLRQLLDNTDQQTQYLQVQLPTFQAKHKLDARRTLQQQGVQDAFDCDAADFSGITGIQQQLQQQQSEQPHLNKLIHQATIKVSAQGISSANTGNQGSIQEQIQAQQQQRQQQNQQQQNEDDYENYQQNQYGQNNQVKANHAFAFVIKHNPSNQILAVGRVVDPTQTPQGQQQQGQNQNEDDGITDQE
jgi:serpin B